MKPRVLIMRLAGTVFGIVSILHLLRVVTGVDIVIGNWVMPLWFNWMGFVGAGALSIGLWYFSGKKSMP